MNVRRTVWAVSSIGIIASGVLLIAIALGWPQDDVSPAPPPLTDDSGRPRYDPITHILYVHSSEQLMGLGPDAGIPGLTIGKDGWIVSQPLTVMFE